VSLVTAVPGVVIVKTAPRATQQLVCVLLVGVNLDGPEAVVIHVMHISDISTHNYEYFALFLLPRQSLSSMMFVAMFKPMMTIIGSTMAVKQRTL